MPVESGVGRRRLVPSMVSMLTLVGGCWLTADYDELRTRYRTEVIADHPIVYLRFEESRGPRVLDEMGNSDGEYPGTAVDYGLGGALVGDPDRAIGMNIDTLPQDLQGAAMPAGLAFDGNAAFTVELWARPTAFHGAGHLVDHADYSGATNGWSMQWEESGITFARWIDGATMNGGVWSPPLPTGEYRYIVGVFDGSQLRLYVDGTLQRTNPSTFPITAAGAWTIGKQNCNFPCTGNGFAGSFDELAVYDYDLSDSRIEAHHRVGRGE